MALGYGGTYRGSVVDDVDPTAQNRLRVSVPEVYGTDEAWAMPALPPGDTVQLPGLGDEVWITFERGDSDSPVWQASPPPETGEPGDAPRAGLIGKYRGFVNDNNDPAGQTRLLVSVPEVFGDETVWAKSGVAEGVQLPAVGDEVWIEFDEGDPQYPTWVAVW